ncbi:hypothetical protein CI610_03151 [invertebrate metagenome]|uniref:Uncharacterized protein n=1 Tax=invertebrate metagenome TaxID=1711999 RepID=A0A2H9T3Z4_9ZZZZ
MACCCVRFFREPILLFAVANACCCFPCSFLACFSSFSAFRMACFKWLSSSSGFLSPYNRVRCSFSRRSVAFDCSNVSCFLFNAWNCVLIVASSLVISVWILAVCLLIFSFFLHCFCHSFSLDRSESSNAPVSGLGISVIPRG